MLNNLFLDSTLAFFKTFFNMFLHYHIIFCSIFLHMYVTFLSRFLDCQENNIFFFKLEGNPREHQTASGESGMVVPDSNRLKPPR